MSFREAAPLLLEDPLLTHTCFVGADFPFEVAWVTFSSDDLLTLPPALVVWYVGVLFFTVVFDLVKDADE